MFSDGGLPEDVYATCDTRYPYVATTYRVTSTGRPGAFPNVPWLLELQPRQFVEMGLDLAKEKKIRNGDMVEVSSARGKIEAVAVVTPRFRPFKVAGSRSTGGPPWCFGWFTPGVGDSANLLTPTAGDANTMIPETKAFMVNIKAKG